MEIIIWYNLLSNFFNVSFFKLFIKRGNVTELAVHFLISKPLLLKQADEEQFSVMAFLFLPASL